MFDTGFKRVSVIFITILLHFYFNKKQLILLILHQHVYE